MKSKTKAGTHRFTLSLLHYGNSYYIDRIAELEKALARRPRQFQIDLLGEGEISAEWAMLIREILSQRSPKTCLTTHARSTLKNGSVLVWLMGDQRRMAPHARIFFRKAIASEESESAVAKVWNQDDWKTSDAETDPDEVAHVQLLQIINEYLPVKEFADKVIDIATLRQFGLVENSQLDCFLSKAFGQSQLDDSTRTDAPKKTPSKGKATTSTPVQQ
jgi:hypothetical protein